MRLMQLHREGHPRNKINLDERSPLVSNLRRDNCFWIIIYAIEAGSPLGITLMGILPVAIGSISFYGTIREVRLAQNVAQS
jgi:hypothetical protein